MTDLVRDGLLGQATAQSKKGLCYPTAGNLAGQQMDTVNLERAWRYGLRLMVMFAVNSEFLCKAAGFQPAMSCRDLDAIEAQLQAAHDLQNQIDTAAGGPGQGWYQVVTDPAQARRVIGDGKLAVVLGVEAANAFGGCTLYDAPPPIPGVPNLAGVKFDEPRWRLACNPPLLSQVLGASHAIARFERYWELGARHFYLVHNVEGTAGGNSISNGLMHGLNNPSGVAPGGLHNRVPDIDRVIRDMRPQISAGTVPCSNSMAAAATASA